MKVVVLYRPDSEHHSLVDEFVRNFEQRTSGSYQIELKSVDSREGADFANLYAVMQYPAVMVVQDDGGLQQLWQGEPLPLIDEVVAYTRA